VTAVPFNSEQYYKDVTISRANLENELATNPANLAFYIEQAAQWTAQVDTIKLLIKNRSSELYIQIKDAGKATEGYVDAKIQLDEKYQSLSRQLIAVKKELAHYEGAVEALSKKQFSLGSINAMNRVEHDATTNMIPRSTPEEKAERRSRIAGQV
jgi:hypothetical protein